MYTVFQFILSFHLLWVFSSASNVVRPRGVSLQKASFYDPSRPFSCFDGSAIIPFNNVNDDYCDCTDGSDEPGTTACVNGSFYCSNVGHKPKIISSAFVNDGYCDCCDASDEYASNVDCRNNCQVLGEAARAEELRLLEERMKGYNIRLQMAEEGARLKKEKEIKLSELEQSKERVELDKVEKEALKEAAEEPEKIALEKYKAEEEEKKKVDEEKQKSEDSMEAIAAFQNLDVDQDGILTVEELQKNIAFDTNRDGIVSEEEAKFYLHFENDVDQEKFVDSAWSFIKPPYKYGQRMFTPPEADKEESVNEQESDMEEEQESERDAIHEDLEDDVADNYEEEFDNDDEESKDEEIEEEKIVYDEETQRLVDAASAARKNYEDVDRQLRDIVRELDQIKDGLSKDYGPNEEFRPLEGVCYEYTDREYTYKLCPFDYVAQKPANGHGETRLGSWSEWDGPPENKYSIMKYKGGQSCWNGPQRSAEVRLSCATDTQITSVSEPSRCEYLFHLSTPAVCIQHQVPSSNQPHQHSEL